MGWVPFFVSISCYNYFVKNTTFIIAILTVLIVLISGSGQFDTKSTVATNAKDATYYINGQAVTLKNGISEIEIVPGSASKIITRYFGNEVTHDFDKDGREDVAFLLTQETGGTGTFFYVVATLNTVDGYIGSHGLFLGDRIAPQTTEMGKGDVVVVNYADRARGESFSIQPSIGKSMWLILDTKTMQFGEVAQNFEGEADPSRMTLGMNTWKWVSTTYNNDTQVKPRDSKRFTLAFKDNETFSIGTDCNSGGGNYLVNGNKISFEKMMSTMMYCEGSQESDFVKMLGGVVSYHFTSRGELVFNLKYDGGVMVFR